MLARAVVTKESPSQKATKSSHPQKPPDKFAPVEEKERDFVRPKYSWNFGDISIAAPDDNNPPNPGNGRRMHALGLPIQAKLQVGAIDDPLEREADRVAEQVMRMPGRTLGTASSGDEAVWRKCAECEKDEDEEHKKITRKESGGTGGLDGTPAPPVVQEVLRSPGQPLDPMTRAFFEPRFGVNLSHVRIHDDQKSGASTRSVKAQAFTSGNHVVFGAGRYSPRSSAGRHLIAHELTHVLQQTGGDNSAGRLLQRDAGHPGPPSEELHPLADSPYPEERLVLSGGFGEQQVGQLTDGDSLYKGKGWTAVGISDKAFAAGPFTSDMGNIFYVYTILSASPGKRMFSRASYLAGWASGEMTADLRHKLTQVQRGKTVEYTGGALPVHDMPQTRWLKEFRSQYPRLENVGGKPDPWASDAGEMTETGIRVPAPGNTLLPRPVYYRREAAFFAYQGFIHYAELVEAGHDAAATNLAMALYAKTGRQVPTDHEFDLAAYTRWSRRAVASREGLQFGMMVADLAMIGLSIAGSLSKRLPVPEGEPPTAQPQSTPSPAPSTPSAASVRVQFTEAAQRVVDQANAAVDRAVRSNDAAFFQRLGMSQSQINKVLNPSSRLFKAEYGNAVERAAAQGFAQDPLLAGKIRHIGSQPGNVAGSGKPDFVIDEDVWGSKQFVDVTTPGARAAHILRDYGKRVMQLIYHIRTFP